MRRPNIVYVLTDDQGYPPMGAHGHPFVQTPHLDAFHAESVRFENFHVGSTCAPTRAGILTGHHCNSTGVWHTIGGRSLLRRDEWSLADALSEAGYRTGLFGKWHLGDEYPYRPQDRGFERVVCHGGGAISQQPDWWGNDYFDDTYMVDGEPKAYEGYCTDVFFNEALDFINLHRDEPFFACISANAPHGPWNVESKYRDLYTGHTDSENYARFLGMITNIDENFGRLRSALKTLGLEENTLVIFMSDNGQTSVGDPRADMYNAGFRGMKSSPYEGGHRVPFLLRWPAGGYSEGKHIDELTSYVDFMPTLLDLCGVDVPREREFHGESLRPLLEGHDDTHWTERTVTIDTQRVPQPLKWRKSCVMQANWRLVNRTELYDLSTDPGQEQDIAAQHPERVQALQQAYEAWWDLCSERMHEDIPLSVGAEGDDPAVLRGHDLRNDTDGTWVCMQEDVRQGKTCSGWWEIMVERSGDYEFELRRWPEEAGHRVRGAIEGDDVTYRKDAIQPGAEGNYAGSKALDIEVASLLISGRQEQFAEVSPDAAGVRFSVSLPSGPRHVRARFSSASGFVSSAYYVYVRCVKAKPLADADQTMDRPQATS